MEKKNVLLVIRWPVGGIRTFIRYVFRNFDTDRWKFTIVAPAVIEIETMKNDLAGLDVRFVLISEKPSLAVFAISIAYELACNRYHLVHSHGFTSGICAALPAKIWRTPHLMTSHDVINPDQFIGRKGWLKKQAMGLLFSLPEAIHSVSRDAQDNLLRFFPSLNRGGGRCVVIPNGIEVARFLNAEPRDLRGELGLGEEHFLIGFFGRFMSQKGFRYLVEAIELLQQQELPRKPIVLTFGWGGFVREEQMVIKEKALEEYFRFMPFTDNVAESIKGVDVVVMPSLWEACPLLAMEALVCGTPLLGSACIGLREVIADTPSFVVPRMDSLALSEEIRKLVLCYDKGTFEAFVPVAFNRFDVSKTATALSLLSEEIISLRDC